MGFFGDLFGGSSSSSASTSTNTTNATDNRMVIGDGAVGVSGTNNNVTMVDPGALTFANSALVYANDLSKKALDNALIGRAIDADVLSNGFDVVDNGLVNNNNSFLEMLESNSEIAQAQADAVAQGARALAGAAVQNAQSSANTLSALGSQTARSFSELVASSNSQYDSMLYTTGNLLDGVMTLSGKVLQGGMDAMTGNVQALATAIDTTNSKGTLDNRTISILGVAAAAAVAVFAFKKR